MRYACFFHITFVACGARCTSFQGCLLFDWGGGAVGASSVRMKNEDGLMLVFDRSYGDWLVDGCVG